MSEKIYYRKAANLVGIQGENPTEGFVVWWYAQGSAEFYRFLSASDFYVFLLKLSPNQRTYYETVRNGAKQKPRFDIDALASDLGPVSVSTLLGDIISGISAALTHLQLPYDLSSVKIYSSSGFSSGGYKHSFHIVLTDFLHFDSGHAKRFYQMVASATHQRSRRFLDSKVYNSVQQFRAYGNTKANENRHKYLLGTGCDFSQFLNRQPLSLEEDSTSFFESLLTLVPEDAKEICISPPKVSREIEECEDVDIETIKELIPPEYQFDKRTAYGYRLERICRGTEKECIACGRSHASNGAYIRVIKGVVTFCCFADEKRRKIGLGPAEPEDKEPKETQKIEASVELSTPRKSQEDKRNKIKSKMMKLFAKIPEYNY